MNDQVVLIEGVVSAVMAIEQPGTCMGLLQQLWRVTETPLERLMVERLRDTARQLGEQVDQEAERLVFPAGWCPAVQQLLQRAGIQHLYQDNVPLLPSGLSAADIAPEHRAVAQALLQGARGQIVLERWNELPGHLAVLYLYLAQRQLYPLQNMVVCCFSDRLKRRLAQELKAIIPETIGVFTEVQELGRQEHVRHDQEEQGIRPKIFVANWSEFDSAASNPDAWDVYVIVEGRVARRERVGRALDQRRNTPRYCLRIASEQLYPEEELTIAERFGKRLYVKTPVPMQLVKIPFNTGQSQQSPKTVQLRDGREVAEYKRQQLWKNQARNVLVAKIARAVENRDAGQLCGLGCETDDALREQVVKGATVSIVVENEEHGQALLALLPDWTLKTGLSAQDDASEAAEALEAGTTNSDEEIEVEIVATAMDRCIVTETRLSEERLDTQIAFRAGGAPEILDNAIRSPRQRHLTRWLLDLEEPRIRRKADPAIRPKVIRQSRQTDGNAGRRGRNNPLPSPTGGCDNLCR